MEELWNLNVPPKWKHFAWRTASGCFPVASNLKRRGVNLLETCLVYSSNDETILHSLVYCSFARNCWDKLNLPIRVGGVDFSEWVQNLFNDLSIFECEKVVALMWGIWCNRNNLV